MIGIKLQGRLGNQLFQFAFIYATAKKLKTSFYIDQTNQKLIIQNYFDIPTNFSLFFEKNIFSIPGYNNLFSCYLKKWFYLFLQKYKAYNKVSFTADSNENKVFSSIENKTLFEGYFLSESYFNDYSAAIRKLFNVKQHLKAQYQNKYARLFMGKKIITVHIRKDDYLNLGHLNLGGDDLSLPITYYHSILSSLQSEDALFVFISDDIMFVKNEFSYLKNKLISNDEMIHDFQHLLNADICIIANSTFGWWGAWLNNKPSKKIYAPEHFMGHIIDKPWPEGIYPPEWVLVNVNDPLNNL